MCGICGFAGFSDQPLLQSMTDLLRHRGPDDSGFHTGPQASLGCRRLSIIDLPGGHQPMYNENRSVALIQNGEIFNYRELQEEVRRKGHRLASQSDTEVLVHLYEEYGADFCQVLNGDFAIALWDETRQTLLLARDRMGVHPLYYTQVGSELAFASEIKSLLCWKKLDRTLDPSAIDAYLALRYVPQEKTFFKQIFKLAPGSILRFHRGELKIQSYWKLPEEPVRSSGNPRAKVDELLELMRSSVDLRLRADVPVGAYLSGGLDSSLIVALMREINPGPIKTFSIGFGLDTDELPQARATAARYQTDHQEILIGQKDYELLPKIVWHLDEPIGDSIIIPSYRLAQAAARQVKVVTSGEGADEAWGGYIHHLTLNTMGTLDRYLPSGWSKPMGQLLQRMPTQWIDKIFPYPAALGRQGQQVFGRFLQDHSHHPDSAEYLTLASLYGTAERQAMYAPGFAAELGPSEPLAALLQTYFQSDRSPLSNVMALDMRNWLPNYTLFKQDKIGFANSLEIRVPYLDHRVVEFAMRQPDSAKISGLTPKRLLRQAAERVLPRALARKRKQAFYFPVQKVFGKGYNDFVADILGSQRSRERGLFTPAFIDQTLASLGSPELLQNKRLMALLVLELWFQTFVDHSGLAPIPLKTS